MCADVCATKRTSAFAIVILSVGASSASILHYQGHDASGASNGPSVMFSAGKVTLTWATSYETPSKRVIPIKITGAKGTAHSVSAARVKVKGREALQPNTLTFYVVSRTTGLDVARTVTLKVYADDQNPAIGFYGGSLTKRDDPDAGEVPSAYAWYQAIRAQRGTAYTTVEAGLQFAEDFATARMLSGIEEGAERMRWNRYPGTSDDRLGYWVNLLGVTARRYESEESVRRRAGARFMGLVSNSQYAIDAAISATLGDGLIQVYRPRGASFDAPPFGSYHPGVDPGPQAINIFDSADKGPKVSPLASLLIQLDAAYYGDTDSLLAVANGDLKELMENMLPAHMNYRWGINDPDVGFRLDIDSLDLNWLTEV